MSRYLYICIALLMFLIFPREALSQPEKPFKTKYAVIYYDQDKDLDDFIWRLGGQHMDFPIDTSLVSNRVDRVIDRVEAILDMRPHNFRVEVYLRRGPLQGENKVAFYEHKTRAVYCSVDYASDGVVAHEIAHAVICQYFSIPPPKKMQEILTQYVDKYLWSDY